MAKPKTAEATAAAAPTPETTNVETAAEAAATTATATATTATKKGAGGAAIMLEKDGVKIRRVDYIRQEFGKGRKRGEIAKELGVAYQIVFAATKSVEAPAAPTAPEAPASETPAESDALIA